jgi:ribosomal protein S4E
MPTHHYPIGLQIKMASVPIMKFCVILTDHRTAIPVPRRVELRHLKPVPPKKKGDWIVIISGDHQGDVAEINACKTKASKAEVVINEAKEKKAFDFSDICRLTKPD